MLTTFQASADSFDSDNPLVISPGLRVSVGTVVLIAIGTTQTSVAPSTLVDQLGNVGNLISSQVGAGDTHQLSIWQITIAFAGTPIWTVTTTGATSPAGFVGAVLQGFGALEFTSPINSQGGGTSWTSRNISPSTANAQIFVFDWSYSTPTFIADDFVSEQSVVVAESQLDLASLTVNSLGTYNSSWTSESSAGWRMLICAAPLIPTAPPLPTKIPLIFTQRTTTSVALFACINISGPNGAQMLAFGNVATIAALQSEYAQILRVYHALRRQDVSNQKDKLDAAVSAALSVVESLNATLQSMTAAGDAAVLLAHMQNVVAGAVQQIAAVSYDESL